MFDRPSVFASLSWIGLRIPEILVLGVVAAFGLAAYLWWRHHQGKTKEDGDGEMAMQLTDNPLQAYGQKQSPRGSLSARAAERRSTAFQAVRVLYQPVRILVGYIQVWK